MLKGSVATRRRVLIAMPTMQGHAKACALVSLAAAMNAAHSLGLGTRFVHVDSSDIIVARNYFASLAADDKTASHLLFIDSDMLADKPTILALFKADKDVIGAIYARKDRDGFVVRPRPRARVEGNLIQVRGIGMGLTLIRADVLRRFVDAGLVKPASRTAAQANLPNLRRGFFDPIEENGELLSEDNSFCKQFIERCHGEVWGLSSDKVGHVGDFTYRGNYLPLAPHNP